MGVLRFLTKGRPVFIPDSVEREINAATNHVSATHAVLDADWIKVYRSTDPRFVQTFARYADRLVADGKNTGECGVLAMGELYGCEIVIDDLTAHSIAEEKGLRVTASVPLLCQAIRMKKLTMAMVEALADDLLEGEYHLPFGPGGFRRHVIEHGLLDYDEI
nr:nucleotide-binding protein [Actinomadura coerulea]